MGDIGKGMTAGFEATVFLSILMLLQTVMGLMPELNVIPMLCGIMGSGLVMGWLAHFMIGIIYGGLFAVIRTSLPGNSPRLKGMIFGVGAWVMMMVAVMPMAGAGIFGMKLGMTAPVMTLMLHLIFGALLGGVYAALRDHEMKIQFAAP